MNKLDTIGGIGKEIDMSNNDSENKDSTRKEVYTEVTQDVGVEDVESAINVKSELGKNLEDFYTVIKKKFSGQDIVLTPNLLAIKSTEKLAPIIEELRDVLKNGGSAEPDVLIQALIDEVQDNVSKGKSEIDFLDQVTNQEKIVAGSVLHKFLKYAAKGLE